MKKRSVAKLIPLIIGMTIFTSSHGSTEANNDIFKECLKQNVTTINGRIPPGELGRLVDTVDMIKTDKYQVQGQPDHVLIVSKGIRKAGTRVGIHVHKYGGHTCVLSGAITDFVEGHNPQRFVANQCYYMPPNVFMTAANLGTEDAVLIDTFIVPKGKEDDKITICEHGY